MSAESRRGTGSRMPVVFAAHGAPVLLDDPEWIAQLAAWAGAMPKPKSILMISAHWEERLHALKGLPHVIDIRNIGLIGAVEFAPVPDKPAERAFNRFVKCFEKGLLVRQTGDIIALSPPLIIETNEIDHLFDIFAAVLKDGD